MHEEDQRFPSIVLIIYLAAMADFPHYPISQFGDTTLTKVFVGGLAWETRTEEMQRYFLQFGEILEAVIIRDKNTGNSKGYGFVTFREPEAARRACANPNPIIDGRRANCNIASLGRPRPPPSLPPPGGRTQVGNPQSTAQAAASHGGFRPPFLPPPPPPQFIYPPYGFQSYNPHYTAYHQAIYSPQVQQPQLYHQLYGTSHSPPSPSPSSSSSSGIGSPYYYGYSSQAPRGTFSSPYPYYANYTHIHQGSFYTPMQQMIITPTGSQTSQHTPTGTEAGISASNSPNTS